MTEKFPLAIVLDNIRSAYNVGSVLRTADCAGIAKVITTGYTPDAAHPRVLKTSLGAEKLVASEHFATLEGAIVQLLESGYKIYVLESGSESKSLWDVNLPQEPTAFIFGNEVLGVQLAITEKFSLPILEIPMFGEKASLNIANAVAIACYDVVKSWTKT